MASADGTSAILSVQKYATLSTDFVSTMNVNETSVATPFVSVSCGFAVGSSLGVHPAISITKPTSKIENSRFIVM
jgi:hypothetical protein